MVAVIVFSTNVLFAHTVEKTFWDTRRSGLQQRETPAQVRVGSDSSPHLSSAGIDLGLSFSIPFSVGKIRETYITPDSSRSSPPVVIVQDVHLNSESQRNISLLIEELATNKKIQFIGVEGAFRPFNFEKYRRYPRSVIKKVAEHYLNTNKIAAPSYVGIFMSDKLPRLVGVDDLSHYRKNLSAYLQSQNTNNFIKKNLDLRMKALSETKARTLNERLKHLDAIQSDYWGGRIGLAQFAQGLESLVARSNNPIRQRSEQVSNFIEAHQLEGALDFNRVELERDEITRILLSRMPRAASQTLISFSLSYKAGRVSYADFYHYVASLLNRYGISLESMPAFRNYIRYIFLADRINSKDLFSSVEELRREAEHQLCQTNEERNLMVESRRLFLLKKLVDFGLTPEEWKEHKRMLPANMVSDVSLPSEMWKPYNAFYEEADIRSQKMVENLLSQFMATSPASDKRSSPVLIVGGFHTPEITRRLREKKLSYVVVQPRITRIEKGSGSEYLSIFNREKASVGLLFQGEKLFLAPFELSIGTGEPWVKDREQEIAQVATAAMAVGIKDVSDGFVASVDLERKIIGFAEELFELLMRTPFGGRASFDLLKKVQLFCEDPVFDTQRSEDLFRRIQAVVLGRLSEKLKIALADSLRRAQAAHVIGALRDAGVQYPDYFLSEFSELLFDQDENVRRSVEWSLSWISKPSSGDQGQKLPAAVIIKLIASLRLAGEPDLPIQVMALGQALRHYGFEPNNDKYGKTLREVSTKLNFHDQVEAALAIHQEFNEPTIRAAVACMFAKLYVETRSAVASEAEKSRAIQEIEQVAKSLEHHPVAAVREAASWIRDSLPRLNHWNQVAADEGVRLSPTTKMGIFIGGPHIKGGYYYRLFQYTVQQLFNGRIDLAYLPFAIDPTAPHYVNQLTFVKRELQENQNIVGAVVTRPGKEEFLDVGEVHTDAGAVNYIVKGQDNRLHAYAVDGKAWLAGVEKSLGRAYDFSGKNIVVLGTGGAAKELAIEFSQLGVNKVTFCDPNPIQRKSMVDLLSKLGLASKWEIVEADSQSNLSAPLHEAIRSAHVVINATGVGRKDTLGRSPLMNHDSLSGVEIASDLISDTHTQFLREATRIGVPNILTGQSMFIFGMVQFIKGWVDQMRPEEIDVDFDNRAYGVISDYLDHQKALLYQKEASERFRAADLKAEEQFDPQKTSAAQLEKDIRNNTAPRDVLFHHVLLADRFEIRRVYQETMGLVRDVLGPSVPLIETHLETEIHVTVAGDDVAPQEKIVLTLNQLENDLREDVRGVGPFGLKLIGPHLMKNGAVVMEYTTDAKAFYYLREKADQRREKRNLSKGNEAFTPNIIHSTVCLIRDFKISQIRLKELKAKLDAYRASQQPIEVTVSQITATYLRQPDRRFIESRHIPLGERIPQEKNKGNSLFGSFLIPFFPLYLNSDGSTDAWGFDICTAIILIAFSTLSLFLFPRLIEWLASSIFRQKQDQFPDSEVLPIQKVGLNAVGDPLSMQSGDQSIKINRAFPELILLAPLTRRLEKLNASVKKVAQAA